MNKLLLLALTFSYAVCPKNNQLDAFLLNNNAKLFPLDNQEFIRPNTASTPRKNINAVFTIKPITAGKYFKVIKDIYKTTKNDQFKASILPTINIHLMQQGDTVFPQSDAFVRNEHPLWEWQISQGKIWQEKKLLKIVLPFALQEKNANCTHNGYMVLAQSDIDSNWHGYFQITGETCAYLQYDLAAHLQVKVKETTKTFIAEQKPKTKTHSLDDLHKDYPKLNIEKLLPINPATNTTSGLFIKGKHYQLSCKNRTGIDPYCAHLVLPSYSTAKSLFAGIALMRLQKIIPNISRVSVHKIIPQCDKKRWGNVSLDDLLNMRTGNYLSKKPHVDENSKRMLDFFLAETHQQKLKMACTMFKHKSKAGKNFIYHSSDTYLAGVVMNKLFQQISKKNDLFTDLMINDLWKPLKLSKLFATSKRTYDKTQQVFTGWGLSYYADDLIQLVSFIQQAINTDLLDKTMLKSALQIGDERFNRGGGEVNMAYNYGFWALEVGHSLKCKKQKWLPFMSGFGGISIVLYQPDIFYYTFADDHQYQWLKVVKALNEQFLLCEDN